MRVVCLYTYLLSIHYIDHVDKVGQQLRNAGMTIQQEIQAIGHFKGIADEDKIEQLKLIPGVASVKVIGEEGEQEPDDYSISEK
jgi:hypothetical protein